MSTSAVILIVLGVLALSFILLMKLAAYNSVKAVKKPPEIIPDDSVQCFSCGMVVQREKALEKKGRHFCGVKRTDREGNPVTQSQDEVPS